MRHAYHDKNVREMLALLLLKCAVNLVGSQREAIFWRQTNQFLRFSKL